MSAPAVCELTWISPACASFWKRVAAPRPVADATALDPGQQLLLERVVDLVLDVDAARRRALLAGRPEGARVGRLGCAVEVGVGHHDQGVVTAELELDTLPELRRVVAHRLTGRDRAGEREGADAPVLDERRADGRAAAGEDVQHTGRKLGLRERLCDVQAREG